MENDKQTTGGQQVNPENKNDSKDKQTSTVKIQSEKDESKEGLERDGSIKNSK